MTTPRVEKLPFTVYDIVGYLVPGAFLILQILSIFFAVEVKGFFDTEKSLGFFQSTVVAFLFLLGSYISGHVISIVASETVERLVVGFVGYPSQYLTSALGKNERAPYHCQCLCKFFQKSPIAHLLLVTVMLPYSAVLAIVAFTKFSRVVVKPLGPRVIELVNKRFKDRFPELGGEPIEPVDQFRLIDHYVFEHGPGLTQARQYNYVTLYGFCRNSSWVLYLLAILGTIELFNAGELVAWGQWSFWKTIVCLTGAVVLLFGFLKYSRRYSSDAYMAFAVMGGDVNGAR